MTAGTTWDVGTARAIERAVLDVHDDVAGVVVHGGHDYEYLHVERTGAGWKIANALWRPA